MSYASDTDEEIYGMGLQYTVWDFKGRSVPLISAEGGVGRGLQPISRIINADGKGGAGTDVTSYAPSATYITNKHRAFVFNPNEIGIADFTQPDAAQMLYWHASTITGRLIYAPEPMQLAQLVSKTLGPMEALPEWVLKGAVVGMVGGQDFINQKYALLKQHEVPLAGIWMQDWVGQYNFPEGTRLLWNWQLNRDWYYEWDSMIASWAKDDVRPFIYINPYIADLSSFVTNLRENYFEIGQQNGYFVKNQAGGTYLTNSLSIQFATVDLTNPAAREWIKSIIKNNMINEAKAGGWMHDFGEYLPFDVVLFDGSDPVEYHNRYPDEWAKVCKEAMQEIDGGNEIVFFMRAGSSRSAKYTRLFWMGD